MSAELTRGLAAIELMSRHPEGLTFSEVVAELMISNGPTHRLLSELIRMGYARLDRAGRYRLTFKAASIALQYLARIPMIDLARPLLEDLARESGELARLNLIDGSDLMRVAKAQGRSSGLRYDPEHGGAVKLSCAASGYVLLSQYSDDEAIARLESDGFASRKEYGSSAPRTRAQALAVLRRARKDGYLYQADFFEDGVSTLAYPLRSIGRNEMVGILTISGPSVRFTSTVAEGVLPLMASVAGKLSQIPIDELLGMSEQVAQHQPITRNGRDRIVSPN